MVAVPPRQSQRVPQICTKEIVDCLLWNLELRALRQIGRPEIQGLPACLVVIQFGKTLSSFRFHSRGRQRDKELSCSTGRKSNRERYIYPFRFLALLFYARVGD